MKESGTNGKKFNTIDELFDFLRKESEDDDEYLKESLATEHSFRNKGLVYGFAFAMFSNGLVYAIILGLIEIFANINAYLAISLYSLFTLYNIIFAVFLIAISPLRQLAAVIRGVNKYRSPEAQGSLIGVMRGQDITKTLLATIAIMLALAQTCRQLSIMVGGFNISGGSYWEWSRFGFSLVWDNLPFNITQTLGLSISQISPTALWSRILVIVFVIVLTGVIGGLLVKSFKLYNFNLVNDFESAYFGDFGFFTGDRLTIFGISLIWIVPLFVFLLTVIDDGFIIHNQINLLIRFIPTLLGFWLTLQGIFAMITFKSISNKALSLTFISVGILILFLVRYLLF